MASFTSYTYVDSLQSAGKVLFEAYVLASFGEMSALEDVRFGQDLL